nr:hypothetical protein [Tanacetum cinerariifolium]
MQCLTGLPLLIIVFFVDGPKLLVSPFLLVVLMVLGLHVLSSMSSYASSSVSSSASSSVSSSTSFEKLFFVETGVHVTNSADELENSSSSESSYVLEDSILDVLEDSSSYVLVHSKKALYNECKKFTKLSFVVKLLDLKAKNNWSAKSFSTLLELLHEAFLKDNELPVLTYRAKKLTCSMGLEVQRIDACPNDCILYRKAYKDLHECHVCMESRYKHNNLTELDSDVTKNGLPTKLLWNLPIIPRLK